MKGTLLTIDAVYLLAGATVYVGVLTTLRLFLYPTWTDVRPDNLQQRFSQPVEAATRFFTVAIPTWMAAAIVLIVAEWGESTVWPPILALAMLLTTAIMTVVVIRPINLTLKAGVADLAEMTALLQRWMKINNIRWGVVIVFWCSVVWYFVEKPDLPAALG